MATKDMKHQEAPLKLEDAMARLEQVVSALEKENTDLEDALRLYEEGVGLVALCRGRLEDAQRKIEVLKVSAEGELLREPFETA